MFGIFMLMVVYELVSEIKKCFEVCLYLYCYVIIGMVEMVLLKVIEVGVDGVDMVIFFMSVIYGYLVIEVLVVMFVGMEYDIGLDILKLENIVVYFCEVCKKYYVFEGQLKGYDSCILVVQVLGGMFINLESQLKQQNVVDKFDQVLVEIFCVCEDFGFILLVIFILQIVGIQVVFNVLIGECYKIIVKEIVGILKGEYGYILVLVNVVLQVCVLEGGVLVICCLVDLFKLELVELEVDVRCQVQEKGIILVGNVIDDVFIVVLFL